MCRMSVNVDKQKKDAVKAVLKKRGFTMEDAIDMYFDAIIEDNDIPEKVGMDILSDAYSTADDMWKHLNV